MPTQSVETRVGDKDVARRENEAEAEKGCTHDASARPNGVGSESKPLNRWADAPTHVRDGGWLTGPPPRMRGGKSGLARNAGPKAITSTDPRATSSCAAGGVIPPFAIRAPRKYGFTAARNRGISGLPAQAFVSARCR